MPPARDFVLLLTHSADHYTVDRVAQELSRRGAHPLRVDTDDFPAELELSTSLAGEGSRVALHTAGGELRGEEVRAVWLRRVVPPRLDEELEPAWREGCLRESQAALDGFLDGLAAAGCRFINPQEAGLAAQNKLHQLRQARALGLEVPATLVTNDAARVRSFFDQVRGRMVAKMLTPLSQSMEGGQPFVYTSAIGPEDLKELAGLRHSPMVFQERVDKARELRVAVVGGRCFVGAIDASRSEAGQVDWRRAGPGECRWEPGELPAEVAVRLERLVAALGLVYGAVDLIVTPDGRHVFLEVNPGGEWGMLERDLGLPIAAALAEALVAERGAPLTTHAGDSL
ncbi:MAG: MvdC family ATP-grasp ribosomal peptide maturase [Myxococcaceae bacterium]|nr:MvdC family ATP-grasp ribosomal peptide maturase [Myxococcaceae bacterium]